MRHAKLSSFLTAIRKKARKALPPVPSNASVVSVAAATGMPARSNLSPDWAGKHTVAVRPKKDQYFIGLQFVSCHKVVAKAGNAFGFRILTGKTEKRNVAFFSAGFRTDYFLDASRILASDKETQLKNTSVTSFTYFEFKLRCV